MLTTGFSFATLCAKFAQAAERLDVHGDVFHRELARGMVDAFLTLATTHEKLSILRQVPDLRNLSCRRFPDGPLSHAVASILVDALVRSLEPMNAHEDPASDGPTSLAEFEEAIHERAAEVWAAHVPATSKPTAAMMRAANDDLAKWCLARLDGMSMTDKIGMLMNAPNVETMKVACPGQGKIVTNVIHLALMEAVVIGEADAA